MATGHPMNCVREGVFTAVYLGLYMQIRPGLGEPAALPLIGIQ